MSEPGAEERLARLRNRQGPGARYDSPGAPARDLLWVRRGTAYFARKLNELSDNALDAPSSIPRWSRRHVIAYIGYHARSFARLAEATRNGARREVLVEPEHPIEDVAFGATLPAHALRYLFRHSEAHLNVAWRDLTQVEWQASVWTLNRELVPMFRTPWLRAREIWLSAIDLDNGGSLLDLPLELRQEIPPGTPTVRTEA